MTPPSPEPAKQPRDTAYWAEQASVLKVERAPTGALNLNVEGHEVLSPLQGFGQLWQKVYQAHVNNATVIPGEIVRVWKEHFPQFWPKGNRFMLLLRALPLARSRSSALACLASLEA